MDVQLAHTDRLSPWWKHTVLLVLIVSFSVLIYMANSAFKGAPPIPERVVSETGETVFTKADILAGQEIFLQHGLMENGSIWGHGAYVGPDYSAKYLHDLTEHAAGAIAVQRYNRPLESLNAIDKQSVYQETGQMLKENRYADGTLRFTALETASYQQQIGSWTHFFSDPVNNGGLKKGLLSEPDEMRKITAFFAWTSWASVVNRPGKDYSYTNNFPYYPEIGNNVTTAAILWSALSLLFLIGGTGLVLLIFGKFNFLGWKEVNPQVLEQHLKPGIASPGQRAVIKYFVVVSLLFLAQSLIGGAIAHYRADPASFFGFDLSGILPSQILRTWHLQIAIFWIATAYIGGALLLAPALSRKEPNGHVAGINLLFGALIFVAVGSLIGEWMGVNRLLGNLWFWFGHQGWEYLELGRVWQVLLAVGLILWLFLLFRTIRVAKDPEENREISSLFLYAAAAIPLFYLPALFFTGQTHFTIVDTWRFWIIHLWVEGFFELFVTVMVAIIFYQLGIVRQITATRVVYLDAILFLGSGIIGTAHHWYWTGQETIVMALGASFSALEIVPLTLLTLDGWDFIRLARGEESPSPAAKTLYQQHKWTFLFLMAVGFWNFVGAGVFGFLINMPIISYYEVGTMLTSNHGHTAMMGVFGMLALALLVFSLRQVIAEAAWQKIEPFIKISFWSLNIGLLLMSLVNLFPGGLYQLMDVIQHGYWHARSPEFLYSPWMTRMEWFRMPADLIFIFGGALPLAWATVQGYLSIRRKP